MALTVTHNLNEWDDCDTDNWTGDATVGLDTDVKIEGTGCIGVDVDIETHRIFGAAQTAVDLSNNFIYLWALCTTANTLDTKSAGGIQILVEDGSGNQSGWYVGGSDNYKGGWELFVCGTAETPDWNNGTVATLTNIVKIGIGWKNTAKSKEAKNCFVDWVRYASGPALTITGTNTTTDDGWSEIESVDASNAYGIVNAIPGGYLLKGPIQFGTTTATATFSDTGTQLTWADMPVGDTHYRLVIDGSASFQSTVRLGTAVGSGDTRQGVNGNVISTDGPLWELDLDDTYVGSADFNGCIFKGQGPSSIRRGVANSDPTFVSCQWINCGPITLEAGSVAPAVDMVNCTIIDPVDTNGFALIFEDVDTGNQSHGVVNLSCITSGSPTPQKFLRFPNGGTYSVTLSGFYFYGTFTGSTLQHGSYNGGASETLTLVAGTNGTNTIASEYDAGSGTVVVSNDISVTITGMKDNTEVRVYDSGTGAYIDGIENATAGTTDNRSFTFQDVAANVVDIVILNKNYILPPDNRIRDYTIPDDNTSLPVVQIEDRVFENP